MQIVWTFDWYTSSSRVRYSHSLKCPLLFGCPGLQDKQIHYKNVQACKSLRNCWFQGMDLQVASWTTDVCWSVGVTFQDKQFNVMYNLSFCFTTWGMYHSTARMPASNCWTNFDCLQWLVKIRKFDLSSLQGMEECHFTSCLTATDSDLGLNCSNLDRNDPWLRTWLA